MDAQLLREECEKYGLPASLSVLLRHIRNNHAATLGAKDYSLRYVAETLRLLRDTPEPDAELRERVDRVIRVHGEEKECPRCGEPWPSYCTHPSCPQP